MSAEEPLMKEMYYKTMLTNAETAACFIETQCKL